MPEFRIRIRRGHIRPPLLDADPLPPGGPPGIVLLELGGVAVPAAGVGVHGVVGPALHPAHGLVHDPLAGGGDFQRPAQILGPERRVRIA